MGYDLSQQLNHINENTYDDSITANLAEGQFIAVTGIALPKGATQREITVQIKALPVAPGGESVTNSGLYVRGEDETSVKATLLDVQGQEVDSNGGIL